MLVIGLTGGIGAGKSTVTKLFADRGVPVIDADVIAREVTTQALLLLKEIKSRFGDQILLNDGSLNRTQLRHIIFEKPEERAWLEALLHPLIRQRIEEQLSQLSAPYCIVVIPLLFEVKPYSFIDRILVVAASEQARIERIKARDQSETQHIQAILNSQISSAERLKGAHDVILNDGKLEDLVPQVEKLHALYQSIIK